MAWEPARIEAAVRVMLARERFRVSGDLRQLVITALWEYLDRRTPHEHPAFTVDEWEASGSGRKRIVAGCADMAVALAAFEAATTRWPSAKLTLRQGAWVMREWPARE